MKVKIGELAKMTGCQVVTIRYYEKEGLLKRPERTERNYRLYGEEDMARLRFIRHCRQHGMSLDEIRTLLVYSDHPTGSCEWINALIRKTYGGHVFASEIPRSIKAAEISVENKSIYDHDRSGKAALAYENLTREVLSLGKQIKRHRADPVR